MSLSGAIFLRQLKLEFLRDSLISPSHIRGHSLRFSHCVCHLVEASLSLPRSSDLEMPQIVIEHAQQILQRLHQQCIAGNFTVSNRTLMQFSTVESIKVSGSNCDVRATTRNGTVVYFHAAILEACGVTAAILPVISGFHTHLCLSMLIEYCYFGQFNKQNCSIGTLKELQVREPCSNSRNYVT